MNFKINDKYIDKRNGDMVEIIEVNKNEIVYHIVKGGEKREGSRKILIEILGHDFCLTISKKDFLKNFVVSNQKAEDKEKKIFTIRKKLKDCSIAHRLMDYNGKCENLHGHTYHFEIELKIAGQQENGISVDFNNFKEIDNFLQDNWDHAVLVNSSDKSLIDFLKAEKQRYFLLSGNPTAENMCVYLKDLVSSLLKDYNNIIDIKVRIWETDTSICEL